MNLDGLLIECAGEYEKSGFLMYVREFENVRYFSFRVEGYWVGFISDIPTQIPSDILDFLGQIDILVVPFSKSEQIFIEQIEPKIIISFSPLASDLIPVF